MRWIFRAWCDENIQSHDILGRLKHYSILSSGISNNGVWKLFHLLNASIICIQGVFVSCERSMGCFNCGIQLVIGSPDHNYGRSCKVLAHTRIPTTLELWPKKMMQYVKTANIQHDTQNKDIFCLFSVIMELYKLI